MSIKLSRIVVFLLWVVAFVVDEIIILSQLSTPNLLAAESMEIRSWSWRTAYVIVPVLIAFASFWFLPDREDKEEKQKTEKQLTHEQTIALFVLTFLVHGFFMIYMLFYARVSHVPLSSEIIDSYSIRMEWGLNFMLFLLPLAIIPIGLLLRKPVYEIGVIDTSEQK